MKRLLALKQFLSIFANADVDVACLCPEEEPRSIFVFFTAVNPMAGDPDGTEYSSSKPVKARS